MKSRFFTPSTWRFVWQLSTNQTQRKHTLRWLNSLRKNYLLTHKQPWLCFDAIDFLDTFDFQNKTVFEYGSGGSTLYWLQRNTICTSIEHDSSWYIRLSQYIPNNARLDYRLVEPEFDNGAIEKSSDFTDPNQYLSADYVAKKGHFKKYVSQIDEFPDESFDVVLIDGRARPSCIKHSANKVRKGGMLILDNSDREYYTEKTSHFLQAFECHKFVGAIALDPVFVASSIYLKN